MAVETLTERLSRAVPMEAHSLLLEELEERPETSRVDDFLAQLNPRQERFVRRELEALRGQDPDKVFYVRGGSFMGSSEWRPVAALRVIQSWHSTPGGLENASRIPARS